MSAAIPLSAQTPETGFAVRHDTSLPLSELVKLSTPGVAEAPREIPIRKIDLSGRVGPVPFATDPLLGPVDRKGPMPPPIISFDGPECDDLPVVGLGRVAPPDTNGDVGPNHYVSFVNLVFEIFNKTTGASVLGPAKGSDLWIGFGGVCEGNNDGDPIVIFDQFAGRWVMSQFEINSGTQCFAVSQTSDPTGAWHRYAFDVSPGNNDYPKIGVWPDGYYFTFNEFAPSFTQAVAVAVEKDKMIQGQPAQFIKFNVPAVGGNQFFSLQPPHVEGIVPPPAGAPAPFVMAFDDEVWGVVVPANDFYMMWKFHADWVVPGNSTWVSLTPVVAADFNANMCNFGDCVPQPAPGTPLDTLSQFTMYRAAYRNFGTHESLYVSHTTNVGSNRGGVRWAEIRDLSTAAPTVFQQGTHAPAADAHTRWMPSIAADKDGNIAIGYSVSSSTKFPSVGYAGRLASDPLGQLPQDEVEMHAGTGAQNGTSGRWGDYSSMSVDESDNCTFWFTTEYYQTSGSFDWDTRIGSFKFPSCTNGPTGTLNGTVTSANNGSAIANAQITVGGLYSTTTNASGVYTLTVPIGTYDVVASKFGYTSQTATGVVIADGQTTTQDFVLVPAAGVNLDGFVTAGNGANYPLYARVDITSSGPPVTLYTNPANGYYSVDLLAETNYVLTVTAMQPGFAPQTRPITTGLVDMQENFALIPEAACNVPGFQLVETAVLATADFTGGIPAGFTVTNTTTNCNAVGGLPGWNTTDAGLRGNLTGGSGLFAIADSDDCGSSVRMNTVLTSPTFNLTGVTQSVRVQFNSDYRDLCSASAGDAVSLDIWNGTAWTTLFNFCGQTNRRGPRVESFVTSAASNVANAQVRWRYVAGWDWWWEVDNVRIATISCNAIPGGMIYGQVFDENTGLPLNGAIVRVLDTGASTVTGPTPADENIGDGYYQIWVPLNAGAAPGGRTLEVSMPRYGTITRTVVPTPNSSIQQVFNLPAPQLGVTATEFRQRLAIGGSATQTMTINNTGNLDGTFNILEINAPSTSAAPSGPIQNIALPYDDSTKEGYLAGVARDASALRLPTAPQVPVMAAAGGYVADFPTGVTFAWGAALNTDLADIWLSNIAVGGGDDKLYRYLLTGASTGDSGDVAAAGDWAADGTYNARTRSLWLIAVGGDNCVYEFDVVAKALTGAKICPAFGTSMRGLAYNPVNDRWYAGSWNGNQIVEFTSTGAILRRVTVGLGVSGLAINPATGHLFAQVNNATQLVYVLNIASPTFGIIGAFQLNNSSGANAYASFAGAGLEMDCAGNLWSVNQATQRIFVHDSGERGNCITTISWLTETPASGIVPADGSASSDLGFTAAGQTPGCKEAQLLILNNSPYGDIPVEAGLTVSFNDVPAGSFGDAYIHAIAGAGISLGCGGGNFCPTAEVTRRTMSVWLLRASLGSSFVPPPATGIFDDVAPESFAADWIEELYRRGITTGCATDPLRYCPEAPVTRLQMAVFLLRAKEGSSYTPPACEGLFADVPCSNPLAVWAEELYRRGVTTGCAENPLQYCPNGTTTRAAMSIFTTRMFSIPACQQ